MSYSKNKWYLFDATQPGNRLTLPPVNHPVLIRLTAEASARREVVCVGWRITQDGTLHGKARRISFFHVPGLEEATLRCEWNDAIMDGFAGQGSADYWHSYTAAGVGHA